MDLKILSQGNLHIIINPSYNMQLYCICLYRVFEKSRELSYLSCKINIQLIAEENYKSKLHNHLGRFDIIQHLDS